AHKQPSSCKETQPMPSSTSKRTRYSLRSYQSTAKRGSSPCRAQAISSAQDASKVNLCTSPRQPPCQTRPSYGSRRELSGAPNYSLQNRATASEPQSKHSSKPETGQHAEYGEQNDRRDLY